MENKYYTPTLDEFYIGFEYELGIEDVIKDCTEEKYRHIIINYNWIPQICKSSPVPLSNIRVKYLDRENIESLGFKQSVYMGVNCFKKGLTRIYWFNRPVISIELNSSTNQIFRGEIKNKSELKVLLKQLNIWDQEF